MNACPKLKYILTLGLGLSICAGLAHDVPVHENITVNAAESAYDDSSAYSSFLGFISGDCSIHDATNSMVLGSGLEDNIKVKGDVGGARSLNHFYDPTKNPPIGLTDTGWPWPLASVPLGQNSFDWASISNSPGIDTLVNKRTMNIWSWQNARYYEWLGLTATNPADRFTDLTNMFRAVGQVMHLLEDTSQPQHVRNEQHLDQILNMDMWSRSAIEDYGLAHSNSLNYAHDMLDWRNAGFTQLKDFWDRGFLRAGGATALNNDLSGGEGTLGLAEFCNGNFIGQRAIYGELVKNHSDIHYFALPSLANTTQPNLQESDLWGTAIHGNVTLANFKQGTRLYISKNSGAGVPVTYHSALGYLTSLHPAKSGGIPTLTIADDNVLSNYLSILIPKAVKYSAGMLDYYFRGQVSVSLTFDTNSQQYIFGVTNISGQTFKNGTFYLVNMGDNGIRNVVQTNVLIGTISNGQGLVMAYPGPVTNSFLVVYKGTIGLDVGGNALDLIDQNVGIAVGKTCDCLATSTNISGPWTVYPGFGGIFYTCNASSTNISFAYSETGLQGYETSALFQYTICNPTTNNINIAISANVSYSFFDAAGVDWSAYYLGVCASLGEDSGCLDGGGFIDIEGAGSSTGGSSGNTMLIIPPESTQLISIVVGEGADILADSSNFSGWGTITLTQY